MDNVQLMPNDHQIRLKGVFKELTKVIRFTFTPHGRRLTLGLQCHGRGRQEEGLVLGILIVAGRRLVTLTRVTLLR